MALTVVETEEMAHVEEALAATAGPADQVTQEDILVAYDRLRTAAETGTVPPAPVRVRTVVKRAMPDREILAAMNGLGALLAVRLMLALAVIGAFYLAWMAMTKPSLMAISVLAAYAITTVGPLTYLSTKRT